MELLEQVIYTLNHIQVSGKDNLDMLLGCINALESIQEGISKTACTEKEGGE